MKTVRRPPYPKWNPGYFPCSSLTPLPLSSRRRKQGPFDRSAGYAAPYFGLRSRPSLDAWAMGHRSAVSRQGPGAGPVGGQALEVRVAVGPVGRGLAGPECEMDEAASARVGGGGQLCHAAVAVPSASHLRAAAERTRRYGPTIWPGVHLRCECALQMGCCVLGIYG